MDGRDYHGAGWVQVYWHDADLRVEDDAGERHFLRGAHSDLVSYAFASADELASRNSCSVSSV